MVDLNGSKRKIRKHIDAFNEELFVYLKEKGYPFRPKGFIWRLFTYLRVHPELWEAPDWKCLYEECLNYLAADDIVESNKKESPERLRAVAESICKFAAEKRFFSFEMTSEIVGDYLRYRKWHWLDKKTAFFEYETAIKKHIHG